MDAVPPEGRGLGGEELVDLRFELDSVVEVLVLEELLEGAEQVEIRGGQVWGIRWVREDFPSQLDDFLAGHICNVGAGVIVEEYDLASSRPLLTNRVVHFLQLVGVNDRGDGGARLQELAIQHALRIPSNAEQNLLLMGFILGLLRGRFSVGEPLDLARVVRTEDPTLIPVTRLARSFLLWGRRRREVAMLTRAALSESRSSCGIQVDRTLR